MQHQTKFGYVTYKVKASNIAINYTTSLIAYSFYIKLRIKPYKWYIILEHWLSLKLWLSTGSDNYYDVERYI